MVNNQIVSTTEDGIRLKRWVKRYYSKISEGEFYKLCRSGQIRINSSRCRGDEILHAGDILRLPPFMVGLIQKTTDKQESGIKFSLADLEKLRKCIIHDDPDFIAFNKPAGLAVQGGTGIKKSMDKMVAALFPYDSILPVHRLDKETSGVIIFAKNQRAAQKLASQFQDKIANKEYLALLSGSVSPKIGTIDNFITKGKVFDDTEEIPSNAQHAVTKYKVITELPEILSWVKFIPITGRTHQLRIHSAFSLGAPIIGDRLYMKRNEDKKDKNNLLSSVLESNKLFLFAHKLSFKHPTTGKIITVRAQMPSFMTPVAKFLELKID
ncbi:MAG: RluA family pseudouridine synthase [Alphaproteobacteria bacterium]|jgi:23S rRNA pseudouridine955/2504/2580 synthase